MPTVLTSLQDNFLREFFRSTTNFYLTGGTALSAFYLLHRFSEDLDLFTQNGEAMEHAGDDVKEVCDRLRIEHVSVRITPTFKHFQVGAAGDQITLHFARDFAPHLHSPNSFGSIVVDSIEDIAANKICAALGRTEIKDLIDLFFLDQAGYTVPGFFDAAKLKDAGLSWETLAYTLSQFHVSWIPPFMLKSVTIENLQCYLESTISWLIQQATPPTRPPP